MTVRKAKFGTSEAAVVEVHPSPTPPVRYNGVVWIRVGPRLAVASIDEDMPLAQEARKPIFFLKPADGAFGGHFIAAQEAYGDFRRLADRIETRMGEMASL
jgi:hypothetical protein